MNVAADTDLFGKVISDLQSDVFVGNNTIAGTLKYVDDYTGFSGDPALQVGNFLTLHCSVAQNVTPTIKVTVTNPSTLDEDGIIVLRIADKDSQTITVVASAEGYADTTRVFVLNGLTCEPAPNEENGVG